MKIELLQQLVDSAKKNKKGMRMLKEAAVRLQLFEVAAEFRGLEKEYFPESEEVRKEKEFAEMLRISFNLVGVNTDKATCWLIYKTTLGVHKKKGKFSMSDAAAIQAKQVEIFDVEPKS